MPEYTINVRPAEGVPGWIIGYTNGDDDYVPNEDAACIEIRRLEGSATKMIVQDHFGEVVSRWSRDSGRWERSYTADEQGELKEIDRIMTGLGI